MTDASQRWNLFGYDLSRIAHYLRAGWRDFFWADTSPILPILDEVVLAHLENGEQTYLRAGRPAPRPADAVALSEAVVLPSRLVLAKTLWLPVAAESNLESVIAMEVNASSPFPGSDTCFGWSVLQRGDERMEVQLVLSSLSAVMTHIGQRFDSHDVHAYEVWAQVSDRMVMLRGFGENTRQSRNARRLTRMGSIFGLCLILLVAIAAVAAGAKYLELQRVLDMQQRVQNAAGAAVALRDSMVGARDLIDITRELMREHPSPHAELKRLAQILGDDTWVSGAEIRGSTLRIEGQSANASAVMQQLLDDAAYSAVEAPVAFKTVRSGEERFVLDLTLATAELE
ncbi:MAG: PilN domain-containing protein [Halioglobus sp.]